MKRLINNSIIQAIDQSINLADSRLCSAGVRGLRWRCLFAFIERRSGVNSFSSFGGASGKFASVGVDSAKYSSSGGDGGGGAIVGDDTSKTPSFRGSVIVDGDGGNGAATARRQSAD